MKCARLQQALLCSLILILSPLLSCHSAPGPIPLDQLNASQIRGYYVFQSDCSKCHNARGNYDLHGPALLGIFRKPYLRSGAPANDERVTATILHGRNLMPAQPDMDPNDLSDLLAYLHSL